MNKWVDMEPQQESYTICMLIKNIWNGISNGKYKFKFECKYKFALTFLGY